MFNSLEGNGEEDDWRAVVRIVAGELHRLTDEAEAALIGAGRPIYQRGVLVRPATVELAAADDGKTTVTVLNELGAAALLDEVSKVARWCKWSQKRKAWVSADPPIMVARILLSRFGQWHLPVVRGIFTAPTLRSDGSLLTAPGYDEASGYYLQLPSDFTMPPISAEPEKSEADAALRLLEGLLDEFPFTDDVSRSVCLSGLMTPVIRAAMPIAPLHAINAPAPGTGKSYYSEIAAALALGQRCPVVFAGTGPEEFEKKVNGALLQGIPLFAIDNLEQPLSGDLLCQASERPLLALRRLGKSDIIITVNAATIHANGNNLVVAADMIRRVVQASMDAGIERPENRRFARDPFADVLATRGIYIAAVLTIVRAYLTIEAWEPVELYPVGSYEAWTRLVRSPLVWLDRPDPADSMAALRDADPALGELRAWMDGWEGTILLDRDIAAATIAQYIADGPPVPAQRTADTMRQWQEAKARWAAFAPVVLATCDGKADARAIGYYLRRVQGRIVDGKRFVGSSGHAATTQWRLTYR